MGGYLVARTPAEAPAPVPEAAAPAEAARADHGDVAAEPGSDSADSVDELLSSAGKKARRGAAKATAGTAAGTRPKRTAPAPAAPTPAAPAPPGAKRSRSGPSGVSHKRKAAMKLQEAATAQVRAVAAALLAKQAAAAEAEAGGAAGGGAAAPVALRARIKELEVENARLVAENTQLGINFKVQTETADLKRQLAVANAKMRCGGSMMSFLATNGARAGPSGPSGPGSAPVHTPGSGEAPAPTPQQLQFGSGLAATFFGHVED